MRCKRGTGGSRTSDKSARFAATAVAAGFALLLTISGAAWGGEAEQRQILLKADEITYDSNARVVTARGHVEISDEDRTLLADEVTYDEVRDLVTATGNVSLQDATGNVAYADHVELTQDLREGALQGFAALIGENARVAASAAERHDGRITIANGAVFTPCAICREEGNRMPLWQIRAARITHDQVEKRFRFEDATFEFLGHPVFFLPFFSSADPSVKHKSGFLLPDAGSSTYLGTFVKIPYYLSFGASRDLTLEPFITTRAGVVLQSEYRQRWNEGGMWLQGTLAYDPGAEGKPGRSEWNGSLFGSGRFPMRNDWRAGFDVQLTSNDTYLQRYELNYFDRFTTNLFVDHVAGRNRLAFDSYFFQSVRAADVPGQIPLALPFIEYNYIPDVDILGGRLRVDTSALVLTRDIGTDMARGSASANWRAPFITSSGNVFTIETLLRGDLYYITDATFSAPAATKETETIGRALAYGMLEWRWPFARELEMPRATVVVEPIAQLVFASSGGNPIGLPNEDSTTIEFDATNLFSPNQSPGLDLWPGGTRTNVGMRVTALLPRGSVEATLGQDYRLTSDTPFAPGIGVGGRRSDIVGQIKFQFPPNLVLTQQFNIDPTDGSLRRNEIYLKALFGRSSVDFSYVKLPPTAADPTLGEQEQISLNTTVIIYGNWGFFGTARRDLAKSQMLESAIGVRYEDECFVASLGFHRRDTATLNLKPASAVIFRLGLKTGLAGG